MSEPEAEPEAETIDAEAMFELALAKAKEVVEEADGFTQRMRHRAMLCREMIAVSEAMDKLGAYNGGDEQQDTRNALAKAMARLSRGMGRVD